ncbi:MAG: LCP family protein [Armatimonadetes bacterium]|nr:LCP family protein [Armatimonadota bacterium]
MSQELSLTASDEHPQPRRKRRWLRVLLIAVLGLAAWQAISWVTPIPSPVVSATVVTDNLYDAVYSEGIIARADSLPAELNILLVGLDNRVASTDNHADAIHLVTIHTKEPVNVTIQSIPRGTPVTGYGIPDDLSFMANVRALRGRNSLMKAVAKLAKKRKIDYYVEVSFSQVMGVLELLGYKDPATALQFLRHRKSYALGDVQRSYNQGKFLMTQAIRRGDMLTGAKGDVMLRMGLGMVDTDLDLETVQAIVYLLKERGALNQERMAVKLLPSANSSALVDTDIPDPDQMNTAVNSLIRKLGSHVDDLGRYDPYPKIESVVDRAESQRQPKAALAVIKPVYEQKAWLQIQERPRRQEIRDRVERILMNAYNATKQPQKAMEVHRYMADERKAFSDVEGEHRNFSYGRRYIKNKPAEAVVDTQALIRAQQDEIGQKQTPIEPQEPHTPQPQSAQQSSQQTEPSETPQNAPQVQDISPASTPQVEHSAAPEKQPQQSAEPQVKNVSEEKSKP